jgi:hypothetical protein
MNWFIPVKFEMLDGGAVSQAYLHWSEGYKVESQRGPWEYVAPPLVPGKLYWFTVSYNDGSQKCTATVFIQWDPPEGSLVIRLSLADEEILIAIKPTPVAIK